MPAAPSTTPIPGTAWRHGRLFCGALWAGGATAALAMAAGLLPGGPLAAVALLLALCVTIAVGVISQRSGFFATPLNHVFACGRRLAITFDDGPHPQFTPRVLEVLRRRGHRATFFVVGQRAEAHPDVIRRTVQEGHEVANHSLRHSWQLALWPVARVVADLRETSRIITAAGGPPPTLFRPPAAILSPRVDRGARQAGLRLVGFSARAADGVASTTAQRALERLVAGIKPGAILLLHDGAVAGRASVALEILPALLDAIERQGLRAVPLSELLAPEEASAPDSAHHPPHPPQP